jgi:hypothetical protein
MLLRLVSHRHLGHSFHLRHHYNLHIHAANNQKGVSRPISRETSGRSLKLAQSTILCQSRSISTKRYPTPESVFTFMVVLFLVENLVFLSFSIPCNSFVFAIVKIYLLHRLMESKKSPRHKKPFLSYKCLRSYKKSFY